MYILKTPEASCGLLTLYFMGHVPFKTNGHLGSRYLYTYCTHTHTSHIYIVSIQTHAPRKMQSHIYVYTQYICIYTIYMYTYIYICNICNIHVYICSQPQGLWPGHARMMNHLQVGKWISPTKRHLAAWEAPGERAEMVKSMAWFKGNLNRKPWFFPSNHGFFLQIFPQTNPMVKRWYFYVGFFMGLWDSLEFNGISTGFFIRFLRISWDLETPMSWFFTFVAKATALDAAEANQCVSWSLWWMAICRQTWLGDTHHEIGV